MLAIFFGFLFGILGGCGIGGGSILIPLLVLVMHVPQKIAQGVCLVAFLPAAVTALMIHIRGKRVEKKLAFQYMIPGVLFAALAAFLVPHIPKGVLQKAFGIFLIIFSLVQCYSVTKSLK